MSSELDRIRIALQEELDQYKYEAPDQPTIGATWSEERVRGELAVMRRHIVEPYWVEVEARDTFEQVGSDSLPRRRCAVVAEDKRLGIVLLFDEAAGDYALAQRGGQTWRTIGVRGGAVDTYLSR